MTKARISQMTLKLNAKELNEYRSLVGQLAWPARESMPQLAYAVSDLQQKTSESTVRDLSHANHVLGLAKQWGKNNQQKLIFRPLPVNGICRIDLTCMTIDQEIPEIINFVCNYKVATHIPDELHRILRVDMKALKRLQYDEDASDQDDKVLTSTGCSTIFCRCCCCS